jgi:hypothetical protein
LKSYLKQLLPKKKVNGMKKRQVEDLKIEEVKIQDGVVIHNIS